MFCPYCRAALPDDSRFCSSCGKPIPAAPADAAPNADTTAGAPLPITGGPPAGAARPLTDTSADAPPVAASAVERPPGPSPRSEWAERSPMPPLPDEPEPQSRGMLLIAALLAVLLLVGIGFWLLTRSRGAPVSVTAARSVPVPQGPSVVRSPAAPAPAATPRPQGMPEDIRRYLAFLQGVEAQRKQYEGQLTNQMLAVVPNLLMPNFDENSQPPDQQMVRRYDQMAQQYAQATVRFQAASQQVSVPEACRKLHMYYSTALSLNPRLIMETSRRLASGDYSGLLQMRSSIGKTIEDNYRGADDELARICAQYGVRKSFDIGNGGGGNSILQP